MSIVALNAIIIPFFICVPLILGIYVYRDAKSRGMNPLLWAFIAALAPSLLGLIIYLLVRGGYSNWKCPRCGGAVDETFLVCPQCGGKLKASCPNCGGAIEAGWKVCPRCAQPLGLEAQDFTPPVKPQDKGLWKILLVVILVPTAFLVVLALSFSAVSSTGATHTVHYSELELMMLAQEVGFHSAADSIRDQGKEDETTLYALASHTEINDEMTQYCYLLYLPHAVEDSVTSGFRTGLLGSAMEVAYNRGTSEKGVFLSMTAYSEREPDLQVERDGTSVPVYFVHVTGFDLSQFSLMEEAIPQVVTEEKAEAIELYR